MPGLGSMNTALDHNQMAQYIHAIHGDDDGYITLAVKTSYGAWRQRHFHGVQELLDAVKETYSTTCDIYISANSYYLPIRRAEALRRINALYVDIDFDDLYFGNKNEIIWSLYDELVTPGRIPAPSMIVDSGRGLHMYWSLENLPRQGLSFWQAVSAGLAGAVRNWMKRFDFCKVDTGVSSDAERVMRLPGTFNQRNGHQCRIIHQTDYVYRLDELREEYSLAVRKSSKVFAPSGGNPYYAKLLYDLTKLRDLRRHRNEDAWCRRRMTFYYRHFALLAGFTSDQALQMTLDFNEGFVSPIPPSQIDKHTKSAQKAVDQGKAYRYRKTTLIEELAITTQEMSALQVLVDDMHRRDRRKARRKAVYGGRDISGLTAKQREMQAARAYVAELVSKGKSQAEIAKLTGMSLSKIKRLRARYFSGHERIGVVEISEAIGGSFSRPYYVCDLTPPSSTSSLGQKKPFLTLNKSEESPPDG